MTCIDDCLNNGVCTLNNTCLCPPCFTGDKCQISVNVVSFSLTFAMHYDITQEQMNNNFNAPKFVYVFVIALMLVMSLISNILCLQTFTLSAIRLSNSGVYQILYSCISLVTMVGMQLRMLTMLWFDTITQLYAYRFIACNIIPVIFISMADSCMWISALIAIELVLLECFDLNLYRSRWPSIIASIIVLVFVPGTHIHEFVARRPSIDTTKPDSYTCTFEYPPFISQMDKIFRICHVIIPCSIHFIASLCMLINITRRVGFVRNRQDFSRIFFENCLKRKCFFIPPLIIIFSNLPHLILHLKDTCEDARDISILRLHVAFNILIYLPPSITFFIYIYPSVSYRQKFKETKIGRLLKRLIYRRQKQQSNVWSTRGSIVTLNTPLTCST